MNYKSYRIYLESPEWKEKRRDAIQRAGSRCQMCNVSGPFHVHHRTYERLGRELPDDLTVLCPPCHRKHHAKVPVRNRGDRRREIDQEILLIVETAGLIRWRDVQRQIKAPRAQAWSRAQKLIKTGRLVWKGDKLCLRSQRDLVSSVAELRLGWRS